MKVKFLMFRNKNEMPIGKEMTMTTPLESTERMMKLLQAPPNVLAAVDNILLRGTLPEPAFTGPLLCKMTSGAEYLGVSRSTLWRIIRSGKITPVEIRRGTFRVRRYDLEKFAGMRP